MSTNIKLIYTKHSLYNPINLTVGILKYVSPLVGVYNFNLMMIFIEKYYIRLIWF